MEARSARSLAAIGTTPDCVTTVAKRHVRVAFPAPGGATLAASGACPAPPGSPDMHDTRRPARLLAALFAAAAIALPG
ncbi:MAG TPA: hypothetical protein VF457_06755, partial [Burkholderiaceae bacterium]